MKFRRDLIHCGGDIKILKIAIFAKKYMACGMRVPAVPIILCKIRSHNSILYISLSLIPNPIKPDIADKFSMVNLFMRVVLCFSH